MCGDVTRRPGTFGPPLIADTTFFVCQPAVPREHGTRVQALLNLSLALLTFIPNNTSLDTETSLSVTNMYTVWKCLF